MGIPKRDDCKRVNFFVKISIESSFLMIAPNMNTFKMTSFSIE